MPPPYVFTPYIIKLTLLPILFIVVNIMQQPYSNAISMPIFYL